jgi:hypothetical protein
VLSVRYRFYTQGRVSFYHPVYNVRSARQGFTTRDREKSPLHNHRVALEWQQRVAVADDAAFVLQLTAAGTLFTYRDFVGLDQVRVLDVTAAVALEY